MEGALKDYMTRCLLFLTRTVVELLYLGWMRGKALKKSVYIMHRTFKRKLWSIASK